MADLAVSSEEGAHPLIAGWDGYPRGRSQATDFALRTGGGFERLLGGNCFHRVPEAERYIMLAIAQRPLMRGSALALAQAPVPTLLPSVSRPTYQD